MRDGVIEIRVITPAVIPGRLPPEELKLLEFPGVRVSQMSITSGPSSVENEYDVLMAGPDTVAKVAQAERDGVDAVVIDCMADPGLRAAREAVRIPVIGPSQLSMHTVAMLGQRFSILNTMGRMRAIMENIARQAGVEHRLSSIRSVDVPVLELEADPLRTQNLLIAAGIACVEQDGAEAIIFGCTGMLGCAEAVRGALLAEGYDVPVIDPIPNAINFAAGLVRSRLSHSALTYPALPKRTVVGFGGIALGAE